jgi:hypothetical protein
MSRKNSFFALTVLFVVALVGVSSYIYIKSNRPERNDDPQVDKTVSFTPEGTSVSTPGSMSAALKKEADKGALPSGGFSDEALKKTLLESCSIDFENTPLDVAINSLMARYKIEIKIDRKALESVGLELDEPITKKVSNVSLRSALKIMLGDLELTYMIKGNVLLITTQEVYLDSLDLKDYPVSDLVLFVGNS